MRLVKCRKCGTAVMTENHMLESMYDELDYIQKQIKNSLSSKKTISLSQNAAAIRKMINQIQHLNGQMEDRKTYLSCELSEIIHHIRTHGLVSDAELDELRAKAREKADGRNKADREKIDRLYGNYQNEFSNRTKADPTAKAALSGRS